MTVTVYTVLWILGCAIRYHMPCNTLQQMIYTMNYRCAAGEDLKKIWQGTWVGWKQLGDSAAAGGPLFVKDAFYNFLCPQRPSTV